MPFTIIYIRNERIDGEERWVGSYAEAKELAERAVELDPELRIDILNEGGGTMSQHPRMLRRS